MNTPCDRCRDELPFYAAGTLPVDGAARVATHVAACAACRAALDDWQRLGRAARLESDAQGADLPPIGPVLERARLGPHLEEATRPSLVSTFSRRILAVAVLIAVLLLGGTAVTWPQLRARLTGWTGTTPAGTADQQRTGADAGGTTRSGLGDDNVPGSVGPRTMDHATGPSPIARQATDAPAGLLAAGPTVTTSDAPDTAHRTRPPQADSPSVSTPTAPRIRAATGVVPSVLSPIPTVPPASPPARPTDSPTATPPTATEVPPTPTSGRPTETLTASTSTAAPETSTAPPPTAARTAATPTEPVVTPSAEATGIIAGRVLGSDGGGRAEVFVRAYSPDRPDIPVPPARTDATGAYSLPVAAGLYLVGAEGAGFQSRWFRDAPDPDAAEAVVVVAGSVVAGTDLQLRANPSGTVAGRVSRTDGTAVARALIVAVRLENPADPSDRGRLEAVAFSADDGSYHLSVRQGVYALGLRPNWWSAPVLWWDGKASLTACDLVGVHDDEVTDGVDFTLQ